MPRPENYENILGPLHPSVCWYGYSDPENKVYENLIAHPEIWGHEEDRMIPNPYEIPTKEFLDSELARIQAEWDNDYERLRKAEYPSINELIVALWEGVVEERMSSVMELEVQRQAVKAKYPKGE